MTGERMSLQMQTPWSQRQAGPTSLLLLLLLLVPHLCQRLYHLLLLSLKQAPAKVWVLLVRQVLRPQSQTPGKRQKQGCAIKPMPPETARALPAASTAGAQTPLQLTLSRRTKCPMLQAALAMLKSGPLVLRQLQSRRQPCGTLCVRLTRRAAAGLLPIRQHSLLMSGARMPSLLLRHPRLQQALQLLLLAMLRQLQSHQPWLGGLCWPLRRQVAAPLLPRVPWQSSLTTTRGERMQVLLLRHQTFLHDLVSPQLLLTT